jgi:voltage-gated potassium channel
MSQSQHSTLATALTRELLERLIRPVLMVVFVFLFGTIGFLLVGGGKWSLFDCAYMTSITLTTVGYGETLEGMGDNARLFAMVLMWTGMGVTLYAVSTITGFVVEQNLTRILRERKMEKRIAAMKNHFIVCGMGKTGFNVLKELIESKRPCVVIEIKPERIEWIHKQFQNLHFIQGDATEEEVLKRAGIERASGILAALGEDSHNLLITVQARYVNPATKIVARCHENNLADKFYRAGANYVVNPAFIGGMRMASEMVRPNVVSFLDRMLRGKDKTVRVEEVEICEGSPWMGQRLADVEMREKTGLVPISIKNPEDDDFRYNPSRDEILKVGTVMIVIGNPEQIAGLRRFCSIEEETEENSEIETGDEEA